MTTSLNVFSRAAVMITRGLLTAVVLVAWTDRAMAQTTPPATPPAASQTDTQPNTTTGTVEVGGGNVSSGAFKAGEYNGLENKGGFAIGNVDIRGGGANDSAYRWRITGTDLGLETRHLTADAGVQGLFHVNFGYDELLRNRSDSYQTPYVGTGTNTLTLPSTWLAPLVASSSSSNNRGTSVSARGLVPSISNAPYLDTQTGSATLGTLLTPNATQLGLINAAQSADLGLFHNVNLYTKRTKYDAGFSTNVTPEWTLDVSVRAEHKDGMKPMSTISANSGSLATVIPDLIDTDTEQVNSSVSYRGDRSYLQAGYYGSFFTNKVPSMSWQNWSTGTMNTMSSAPSDTFNQFNMEGRYNLSSSTRLVANGSYGHTTQNDAFLTDASTPVVPVSSLNGLIVSTAFGAKLTSRVGKKLNTTFSYKYDDRDNQTGVHIFQFADAGSTPAVSTNFPANASNSLGAVLAQNANANRPYSKKSQQAHLEADYHIAKSEWVKGGYDFERINRWCTGSWIDCADAGVTNENTLRAEWRANAGARVNARIDYAYSQRRTPNYNENAFLALVPYANVSPASATGGATALSFMIANGWTGWGPALGYVATTGNMNLFFPSDSALANTLYANNNRISEIQGLRRYYVADRNRNKVRSMLNWQATDALSVEGSLDVVGDTYTDSGYGVQSGRNWAVNLDGTYEAGKGVSATVFYSFENQRAMTTGNSYTANSNTANVNTFTALSGNTGCDTYTTLLQRNNNNKLDPCLNWSANMLNRINTTGVTLAKRAEKFELTGDLILSRARSTNDMTGGSWVNNLLALPGAAAGTIAAYYIPAAPLPAVTTNSAELRVNAKYNVREGQSVRVVYAYMRMRSVDWAYDGMDLGAGTLSSVLPTNETAFNFGVHVIGVSYVISF